MCIYIFVANVGNIYVRFSPVHCELIIICRAPRCENTLRNEHGIPASSPSGTAHHFHLTSAAIKHSSPDCIPASSPSGTAHHFHLTSAAIKPSSPDCIPASSPSGTAHHFHLTSAAIKPSSPDCILITEQVILAIMRCVYVRGERWGGGGGIVTFICLYFVLIVHCKTLCADKA